MHLGTEGQKPRGRVELGNTHNGDTEQIQGGSRCQEHLVDGIVQTYSLGKGTGHSFAMFSCASAWPSMLLESQSRDAHLPAAT